MIGACLALQLILVWVQNRKNPMVMAKEMLIALTGMKPGFDAYNVVRGKEMDEHDLFDAKFEMVATKGIEMFCESIPGCILQVYAVLKLLEKGQKAPILDLASIVISATTTGFASATISYDYDTDPTYRKEMPMSFPTLETTFDQASWGHFLCLQAICTSTGKQIIFQKKSLENFACKNGVIF